MKKNEISFDLPEISISNSIFFDELERKLLSIFICSLNNGIRKKSVRFKLQDLCNYLDIPVDEFIKKVKSFSKKILEVQTKNGSIYYVNLFSSIEINKNNDFLEMISIEPLKGLNERIIDIYETQRVNQLLNLKGKYSWKTYNLLKNLEFNREYYASIEYLRNLFSLEEQYKLYADFKRKVLLYTQKEIENKTDIYFSFKEYKNEKKIVGLYIIVHKNPNFKSDDFLTENNFIETINSLIIN